MLLYTYLYLVRIQIMSEYCDVVDENDVVISQAPRSYVHQHKLKHRAAHIFIMNSQQQIFIQKRAASKDNNPNLWDISVAGHVMAQESYEQTALREVEEELGVSLIQVELLAKLPASAKTGYEFIHVYKSYHNGPLVLDPKEVQTGGWFSFEILDNWQRNTPEDFTRSFLLEWQLCKELLQKSQSRRCCIGS